MARVIDQLSSLDAVIVVDVQNDFCPGGALAVPEGDKVIGVLNLWIEQAERIGATVVISRDWHPANHCSFLDQGGPWPEHCVQGTTGAAFREDLRLPPATIVLTKGSEAMEEAYSAFQGTELDRRLRELAVERLWVGGLALDYCVKASALDAAAMGGVEVAVILPATRAVNVEPGDGEKAVAALRAAGIRIIEGD